MEALTSVHDLLERAENGEASDSALCSKRSQSTSVLRVGSLGHWASTGQGAGFRRTRRCSCLEGLARTVGSPGSNRSIRAMWEHSRHVVPDFVMDGFEINGVEE